MRWRYLCILIFFSFAFFSIVSRLFYWQVVKAADLSKMAHAQYGDVIDLPAQRGEIRTSDNFPIATTRLSYLIFANPHEIKQINTTTAILSSLLHIDTASVSGALDENKNRYWISLFPNATVEQKTKIEGENLPGIGFEESYARFYPEASMAAQLLGFVGKDDLGQSKGYFGLEGFYDRQLRGRSGKATEIHDALGRPVLSRIDGDSGQQDGRSLVLTINRSIQFLVEQKLQDGIEKYGAQSGMVIIMDPKTGGIIAMASFPSFDPRAYGEFDGELYKNPAITDTYEPGSTFKPLIMSSALDANVVQPETKCPQCSGPVKVADYELHTWNDKYFPNTTMKDVIKNSDNTGMVYVSQTLGKDKMLSYLKKFGIGDATGIDLQGEEAVPLMPNDKWSPIDLATASFGQGISVTPIELLDAFSAIANNGIRMQPHVVSQIITPDGTTIPIDTVQVDQPISSKVAKVMTEILVYTVNKGEANFARLKGYRIAGKTGTASIPVAGHYDPTQTIASFIGYAPADDPKFAMLVIMNRPTSSIYGAETAAPVFFDIAKDLLTYYGISPTAGE